MSTARNKDDSRDNTGGFDSASSDIELLYVWIERDQTGFIRETGFNLSPNYRFSMKCTEDSKYRLSCTEHKEYYNIWKFDSINGLTALVGENGSGKSLLLRHLLKFGDVHEKYPYRNVYAYLVDGKVLIQHNFPSEQFVNNTEYGISSSFGGPTRIYVSNVLGTQEYGRVASFGKRIMFTPEINSIRVKEFFKKATSVDKPVEQQPDFDSLQEFLISQRRYKNFEALCVLCYYHSLQLKKSDAQTKKNDMLPMVRCVDTFAVDIISPYDPTIPPESRAKQLRFLETEVGVRIDKLRNSCRMWEKRNTISTGADPVAKAYIPLIFELCVLTNTDLELETKSRDDLKAQSQELLNSLSKLPGSHKAVIAYYEAALEEIAGLGSILPESFPLGNTVGASYHRPHVMIDRRKHRDIYYNFCKYIDKLMRKKNSFLPKYISIMLQPQSSGEQALQNIFTWLSLYSSFGEIFNEKTAEIGHNILLLLDEVDLYMHPEWQRKFLKQLSDDLNAEYPDKKIQVIISTHSPLVLSDIPSANCIYLKHEGDICTFASGPEQNRTFGANIFALLKDSFFMKKSLGEFAYSKIVWISQKLNELKDNPNVESREQYRYLDKLIDLIGEPVVRHKLQMLYDEVFSNNRDTEYRRFLEDLNNLYKSEDPEDQKKYQDLLKAMRSGSFGS